MDSCGLSSYFGSVLNQQEAWLIDGPDQPLIKGSIIFHLAESFRERVIAIRVGRHLGFLNC